MSQETEAKIRQIISDEMGVDTDEVTDNADITLDLGGDSLDHVEIIMRLEEEFDIAIDDDDAEKVRTVGDAVKLVDRELAKK